MEEQKQQSTPAPKFGLAKIIIINAVITLVISVIVSFVVSSMIVGQRFSDIQVLEKQMEAFSSKIKIQ
jgi:hypothetical protein